MVEIQLNQPQPQKPSSTFETISHIKDSTSLNQQVIDLMKVP